MSEATAGSDGKLRCPWAIGIDEYERYHDDEWGRPVSGENELFERICLEAFQSGLSWLTILRKREAFRRAFVGFDVEQVARFDADDVERLLQDAGIVRNRAKILAAIGNAKSLVELHQEGRTLAEILRSHTPSLAESVRPAPTTVTDIPTITAESRALAAELKLCGFRFVGPTTAYATMQATGIVNDHLAQCWVREYV